MNILTAFIAWRERRRAERELIAAERARNALVRQMNERRAAHREWKPLQGLLRQATEASLRASIGRRG